MSRIQQLRDTKNHNVASWKSTVESRQSSREKSWSYASECELRPRGNRSNFLIMFSFIFRSTIISIKCHDHWFTIVKIRCRRLNILLVVATLVSFDFVQLFMEKNEEGKSEAPEEVKRWITNNSLCSLSIQIVLETNMARFGTWIIFAKGMREDEDIVCGDRKKKKWKSIHKNSSSFGNFYQKIFDFHLEFSKKVLIF